MTASSRRKPSSGFFFLFRKYLAPTMRQAPLAILGMFLSALCVVWIPKVIQSIIDEANAGAPASALYAKILWTIAILGGYYVIGILWNYVNFRTYFDTAYALRLRMMRRSMYAKTLFFLRFPVSKLISRADHDVNSVAEMSGYGVMVLHDGTVLPLLILFAMASINVWIALAALVIMPTMSALIYRFSTKFDVYYDKTQRMREELYDDTLSMLGALRVIRVFAAEDVFRKRFMQQVDRALDAEFMRARYAAKFPPIWSMAFGIFMVLLLALGGVFIGKGSLTLGDLIAVSIYYDLLLWPMNAVSELVILTGQGKSAMRRVHEVLEDEETFDADQSGRNIPASFASIELRGVSATYPGESTPALSNIDFLLRRGEMVGIAGKVGSGKTTLMEVILRMQEDLSGELLLNGEPANAVENRGWRSLFCYVPQEHFLFSATLRENVTFFTNLPDEEVLRALEAADFLKDLSALPNGLDTVCGERGITLSGGQKQRISLARALIHPGDVLLLDDILSAVDTKTERAILDHLMREASDRTTLIASHRLSALAHCDRIYVLSEGRVIQEGSFDTLIHTPGWFQEQYLLQREGVHTDERSPA